MPNWCGNYIKFYGDAKQIAKLEKMLEDLVASNDDSMQGHRPNWEAVKKANCHYMFDIQLDGDGQIQFDTAWSPAISLVFLLGRRYDLGYVHRWDESGNSLYGKAVFRTANKNFLDLYDGSSLNFRYDFDSGMYIYNGQEYESQYDFIDEVVDNLMPSLTHKNEILRP